MRFALLFIVVLMTAIVGCKPAATSTPAAESVLDGLTDIRSMELLSLDPDSRHSEERESDSSESFYAWRILGQTSVTDADTRNAILVALAKGIEEGEAEGVVAACFQPRHGLVVVLEDDSTHDYVICFQCRSMRGSAFGDRPKSNLISPSPQPVLDAVLKQANVELASTPYDERSSAQAGKKGR